VYPPPSCIVVAAWLWMYLAMPSAWGIGKFSPTNCSELVRLILLLLTLVCVFTVTWWLVVVQVLMMFIGNAWHTNMAVPTVWSGTTKDSPAYVPCYRTFNDDQQIRTNISIVLVHSYLQILTVTYHYG
jgi:hypothetical protein